VEPLTSREEPRQVEWVGEPSVEAVEGVRGQLRGVLRMWGLGEDVVEDAVLVAAELLANVVVHARTPFGLAVHLRGPLLRVSVSDRRVGVPEAGSANPTAGRISGLRLINAVVFRWGWQEHETGKTVWAELIV
jgi:anti-sigma regulatory factor (Ser/Thr protein kinase)